MVASVAAGMTSDRLLAIVLPTLVAAAVAGLWAAMSATGIFPPSAFPSPAAVWFAFCSEAASGRLFHDVVTSLFRVCCGFLIATGAGVPLGVCMGQTRWVRLALLPLTNFFRNLSPLAWMPFAILWLGVGDAASIFLISLSVFFPVVLATMAAVAGIPAVHFQVARSYGLCGFEKLTRVTLPAIMPEVITTLRVAAGVAWLVVVAAEMIAGRDGLGFAVMDSRNGLRTDILVVEMIVIGVIGVLIDRVLVQLTHIPSVRWGYER
jgi:NitT/TauT family transport system permease protein